MKRKGGKEKIMDTKERITICEVSIDSKDATILLNELSNTLEKITGSSGNASFSKESLKEERSNLLLESNFVKRLIGVKMNMFQAVEITILSGIKIVYSNFALE